MIWLAIYLYVMGAIVTAHLIKIADRIDRVVGGSLLKDAPYVMLLGVVASWPFIPIVWWFTSIRSEEK